MALFIVSEDCAQLLVARSVHALVVLVDRFELLHHGHDRAMAIERLRLEQPDVFIKPALC